MMNAARKLVVLFLLTSFALAMPREAFGETWQKPRKEPETVKERDKRGSDKDRDKGKDQGGRKGDDSKKRDDKKKPNY